MVAQTFLFGRAGAPLPRRGRSLLVEAGALLILPGDVDRYVVRSSSSAGLVVRAPGRELELSWPRWRVLCSEGALLPADASDEAIEAAVVRMRGLPRLIGVGT